MMAKQLNLFYLFISLLAITFISCSSENQGTPKPYGYFRITLPQNTYQIFSNAAEPYSFEYSTLARVEKRTDKPNEDWLNIVYPQHRATIYLTYHKIKNNLATLVNDSHTFTYKHTIKADAIDESIYAFPENHTFALVAEVEGNAASPIQFVITDSVSNFIRGALYFDVEPNIDSVMPVVNFIKKDILQLLQTTKWKTK